MRRYIASILNPMILMIMILMMMMMMMFSH